MSRVTWLALSLFLIGCGGNDAAVDAHPGDPQIDAPRNPFMTLVRFDVGMQQLPEGVVSIRGLVHVGLAPLGQIVKITSPGVFKPFGELPLPISNTYTLGLVANANDEIFVAVGASGPNPMPGPGVYKLPAAGGTALLFSSSPLMTFPNGIDLDGTKLYVTDSSAGRILEIDERGIVSLWLEDPMLAGSTTACGGTQSPFPIGANGIAHDANYRYVAVTDHGRIVRIPIKATGGAGLPVVHAESCTTLKGIDGISLQAPGQLVGVRNAPTGALVSIAMNGLVIPIHTGTPLDGPASIAPDEGVGGWVITNSAFSSGDAGKPGVLGLPF